MDLDVLFVGTAGSAPSARRGLPATLVRRGGDRLLFDCGEGTQRQLVRSIGLVELEEIFITHFHADHVLGLPGMLKTFALRQRERPLTVYGPAGCAALFAALRPIVGRVGFPLELRELEPNDELERDGYRIAAYATDHGVGRARLRARRGPAPGRVRPRARRAARREPRARLRAPPGGRDRDGVLPDQVMGEPRRGRRIVLAGDTAPCEMTRLVAFEADLLVHEATFLDEEADRAAETRHSTAPPGGRAGRGRRRQHARAHPHLPALRRQGGARRGARRRSRTPWCRATSTASRSPSPSAASRRS